MSNHPLELSDDDFSEEIPPGFLSKKDKDQYVPWMATLLGGSFVLQMVLPILIMIFSLTATALPKRSQGLPKYTQLTAWQNALWYPIWGGGSGGFRNRSTLMPIDYEGQPLTGFTTIDLDMQPDWLLSAGETLWAVSRGEVAEVLADGSRPVVMHPSRFLQHVSQPFFHEGRLAVVDWDEEGPPSLFEFENGEWKQLRELAIHAQPSNLAVTEPIEAPADADQPENQQRQSDSLFAGSNLGPTELTSIHVVPIDGEYHVFAGYSGAVYYHQGLPWKDDEPENVASESWTKLEILPTVCAYTQVGHQPAIVNIPPGAFGQMELWTLTEGQWKKSATADVFGSGPGTELVACATLDGSRTFAVVDAMGGLSQEFFEVTPEAITQVRSWSGMMLFMNPLSPDYFWQSIVLQIPQFVLLLLLILGATWLMQKHCDPFYYKGRVPVAYASILRRCCALFIDTLISWVPIYVGWICWIWYRDMSFAKFFRMMEAGPENFITYLWSLVPGLVLSLAWFFFWTLFNWVTTSWWGCTVGKYLCGVRVVRTNLEYPGLLRGLARLILSNVEPMVFNGIVAFAMVAFYRNRQRIADLVADTVVVKSGSLWEARAALNEASQADFS